MREGGDPESQGEPPVPTRQRSNREERDERHGPEEVVRAPADGEKERKEDDEACRGDRVQPMSLDKPVGAEEADRQARECDEGQPRVEGADYIVEEQPAGELGVQLASIEATRSSGKTERRPDIRPRIREEEGERRHEGGDRRHGEHLELAQKSPGQSQSDRDQEDRIKLCRDPKAQDERAEQDMTVRGTDEEIEAQDGEEHRDWIVHPPDRADDDGEGVQQIGVCRSPSLVVGTSEMFRDPKDEDPRPGVRSDARDSHEHRVQGGRPRGPEERRQGDEEVLRRIGPRPQLLEPWIHRKETERVPAGGEDPARKVPRPEVVRVAEPGNQDESDSERDDDRKPDGRFPKRRKPSAEHGRKVSHIRPHGGELMRKRRRRLAAGSNPFGPMTCKMTESPTLRDAWIPRRSFSVSRRTRMFQPIALHGAQKRAPSLPASPRPTDFAAVNSKNCGSPRNKDESSKFFSIPRR